MSWTPFSLDHQAQWAVLQALQRGRESLKEAYKMRTTCGYGLERFWGEQIRVRTSSQNDADFWKDVWQTLVIQLQQVDIYLEPQDNALHNHSAEVMAQHLWSLEPEEQEIALSVLTSLCDAVVWWKQRLDPGA
ncbi:hypothetical protein KBY97_00475 [Synechococcus sp. ATX 2A4]|uniref:hypothetical protein n=1 Tax=Synechococcus sp. ATX 2A4 TaxID=2823727 RepID=UPI0020CBE8F8|nr:hypothetical protein [Synechococcus sp. ATX 2A4]MCP9883601.1 hypothetical protein [Synechococcus sp. ATX 2A4]